MANAKPKDIELPKFSDKEREEKKPAAPKETKEVKKVKTPEAEPVVEEKKPEAPKAEPEYYTVVRGDTLTAIARKYGTTVNQLVEGNGIKNPNLIYVGQRFRVK